jgi:glycosyltransferase involved in cell wall biosynthesis
MNVSVVVPVKNGARFISEAIFSALDQPEVGAVVVVDDGSTDGADEVARSIPDPRVVVLKGARAGVSAARNLGFAAVFAHAPERKGEGSWVLFLDADDRLRLGAIARLLADAKPGCVAVYGGYERIDAAGRLIGRRRWLARRRKPSGDILPALAAGNFIVNGGVMLIRRDAFQKIGGFDESLAYCEDWHAFCRLAALGPILYSAATALEYRVHAASVMMRDTVGFAPYQAALDRVFADPAVNRRLSAQNLARLKADAGAHLSAYLACQAVRSHAYLRALPELARAIRSSPQRTPRTMAHLLGAVAGL